MRLTDFGLCGAALAATLAVATAPAVAQTKLLRFPDISGERVAFCYAGDLWVAPAKGGSATRLTAHSGLELFPKFSPDGRWIAFTGQYDGDEQVYVVPATGGVPKQLTYYPAHGPLPPRGGYDNQVYGWTPDGARVLFRSLRDANGGSVETALYTVTADGGLPVKLPMPTAGAGDFSPEGKLIVYSPLFRDFRTWKRYGGGWAQDLFIFDLTTDKARNITNNPRTDRDPMWIGHTIYYASDRDGTLNLYAYDVTSNATKEVTHSTKWDVRWPSSDNRGRIVYELDGELHVLEVASRQDTYIPITVPDDGLNTRPSHYPASKNIEDFELSPKGERVLFVARGDIFTAPVEHGPTRNLTDSSNAHDKWARWSPDGAKIAFVSDMSGEEQLYLIAQDGAGKPEQLTTQFQAMLFAPEWAGDGTRLALSDKNGTLYVVTVAEKKVTEVAHDEFGGIRDYAWSPDGAWLAFSMGNRNGFRSLYIWGVAEGKVHRVTDDTFNVEGPAWDPEGSYLYVLSDREFAPQISSIEWNYAGNRTTGIFALALRTDVKNPFGPRSDEVTVEKAGDRGPGAGNGKDEKATKGDKDKEETAKEEKGKKKDEIKPVKIDFERLAERVARVPVDADNIDGLSATKGHLLYTISGAPFYDRDSYGKTSLQIFSIKDREASVLVEDISGFALSADGSKALVRQEKAYNLYDAKPKAKDKKTVSTKDLYVNRVPALEWEEIFNEVWRRYRDFFYVRNMHGYDWKALGEQYRPLVKYVAHRSDLNYVLGEMVAELSAGHCYLQGGDYETPERAKVGLPGARFELDEKAGHYRMSRILKGDNEEERYRSPLTEVGVDIKPGDYVLAIDGEELRGSDNPYRLLRHKTDPVTLTVNSKPSLEGARRVTYTPVFDESALLYKEWVDGNRENVSKVTGGRVGYLHIPDMGGEGIAEFIKWYYPQIRKEGLIVDVRSNGGGNVSQWVLARLGTKLLGTRFGNTGDFPRTYPYTVFHGHMVCLISETSASDGDIFPHYFRKAGLGPLIGKRTWGGVVGISGRGPLLDGGQVFVPMQGTNDENGNWVIEGHGVDPDIVVENEPQAVIEGRDPQLERGIAEVMKAIKEKPMKLPTRPPDPVKTK
ncbi:MAG: peptidase S41 [Acidobacteria bacterium RBG_13_68_16]|nr:MAG: peptidase S41 [Acidobacteria bacterium RBG_13_68_16]